MKLNPHSTRPQIFKNYQHPWYEYEDQQKAFIPNWEKNIKRPHPPTREAIEKAQFIDKTYAWRNDHRI